MNIPQKKIVSRIVLLLAAALLAMLGVNLFRLWRAGDSPGGAAVELDSLAYSRGGAAQPGGPTSQPGWLEALTQPDPGGAALRAVGGIDLADRDPSGLALPEGARRTGGGARVSPFGAEEWAEYLVKLPPDALQSFYDAAFDRQAGWQASHVDGPERRTLVYRRGRTVWTIRLNAAEPGARMWAAVRTAPP